LKRRIQVFLLNDGLFILNREAVRHEDSQEGGNQEAKLNCTYKSRAPNP
jgi:hypothetical protein